MVQYAQPELLSDLCKSENNQNLGTLLVEVIASVLDNEVSINLNFSIHLFLILKYFFSLFLFNSFIFFITKL